MKREHTEYSNVVGGDIYKHYGLIFWQQCWFCNKDFRRENGFRFQVQVNRPWVYSCAACSSSKEEVNINVREMFHYRRPKAPPAPPRKP